MIPFFAIFLIPAWFALVDGRLSDDEGPIIGVGGSVVVRSSFPLTKIVRIYLSVRSDGCNCIRLLTRVHQVILVRRTFLFPGRSTFSAEASF